MKQSLRRIANTLLFTAVLGLAYSFLSTLSFNCGVDSRGCMAALFGIIEPAPYTSVQGTAETTIEALLQGVGFLAFVQLLSAYMLLIAVVILIALECIELHYLRQFVQKKQQLRLR